MILILLSGCSNEASIVEKRCSDKYKDDDVAKEYCKCIFNEVGPSRAQELMVKIANNTSIPEEKEEMYQASVKCL